MALYILSMNGFPCQSRIYIRIVKLQIGVSWLNEDKYRKIGLSGGAVTLKHTSFVLSIRFLPTHGKLFFLQ